MSVIDNPWRRLPGILPLALALLVLALYGFGRLLERPSRPAMQEAPIEAQLVELPPPTPPAPKLAPPKPVRPKPKPKPVSPPRHPRPPAALQPAPPPASEPTPPVERPPVTTHARPRPTPPPKPAVPATASGAASGSANMGAQAIVRPLPTIPPDLREDAFSAVALARFHVAADGSATVELVTPTPSPRLNRLLLDTLKMWHFFPAIKDGKPVPSVEDIRINLRVE